MHCRWVWVFGITSQCGHWALGTGHWALGIVGSDVSRYLSIGQSRITINHAIFEKRISNSNVGAVMCDVRRYLHTLFANNKLIGLLS